MSREKIVEERREQVVLSENSVPTPSKLGGKYKNTEPEKPVFVFLNGNETEGFCVVMVPLMWPWNTLKTPPPQASTPHLNLYLPNIFVHQTISFPPKHCVLSRAKGLTSSFWSKWFLSPPISLGVSLGVMRFLTMSVPDVANGLVWGR